MYRIFAMSRSRKDLGSWIEDHTFQVMVALAQLYLFPHGNRVHWRKEVYEKFSQMFPFRHNNKLPDQKFILDNSWNVNSRFIHNALQRAIDKETEYVPIDNIDENEFYVIVEDYFMWLSYSLSKTNRVSLQEVLEELDRLGLSE